MIETPRPRFLFDFDGVLFDSDEDHRTALKQALLMHRFLNAADRVTEDWDKMVGSATTIQKLAVLGIMPSDRAPIYNTKKEIYKRILAKRFAEDAPSPNNPVDTSRLICNLLRVGPACIVTNSNARSVFETLTLMGMQWAFKKIVDPHNTKLWPKPHPVMYQYAANWLQVSYGFTGEIIIFEDSPIGLQAARAVPGARVVEVPSPQALPLLLEQECNRCGLD